MNTAEIYQKFKTCSGVSTDTRNITPDCLFVALRGDKFDANAFAAEALSKGAKYAIVSDATIALDDRFLLVEDTLLTLQDLARHHRQQLAIQVVGLTGSNGKTTTKELIASVLLKKHKVYFTKGNLNNHIGVPLTLLAIDDTYQMAVVEMGANHQQEIALLCSIAQPTHGLITNIGKAHLEGFGGIEGVRKGKGELYDYLSANEGTVFVNALDQTLVEMADGRSFAEKINYLTNNDLTLVEETPVIKYNDALGQTITGHISGKYNFENMAAAAAIGKYFGVSNDDINEALASYNPTNNRSQMIEKGTNTVLMDAYNANPSSMAASLQNFANIEAPHKMVIVGDMFELGDHAPAEHAAIGELLAKCKFDIVILIGSLMENALPFLPSAYYFTDKFSLHNWLADHPQQHTHILVKGSRGMGLETVLQFL